MHSRLLVLLVLRGIVRLRLIDRRYIWLRLRVDWRLVYWLILLTRAHRVHLLLLMGYRSFQIARPTLTLKAHCKYDHGCDAKEPGER